MSARASDTRARGTIARAKPRSARAAALATACVLLALAACERLVPDQTEREATSESELARLAAENRAVQRLVLSGPGITDAALEGCAFVRSLEAVVLRDCDAASGAGLAALAKTRSLRELALYDCARLDGAALGELARLDRLETLRVYAERIDAPLLDSLAGCARVRTLALGGTLAPDARLAVLRTHTALVELDVSAARGVAADDLASLRVALPSCIVRAPN